MTLDRRSRDWESQGSARRARVGGRSHEEVPRGRGRRLLLLRRQRQKVDLRRRRTHQVQIMRSMCVTRGRANWVLISFSSSRRRSLRHPNLLDQAAQEWSFLAADSPENPMMKLLEFHKV